MHRVRIFLVIILIGILLFFLRDLGKPGLPMFHDSNPHISRAIAYHTALLDGQFPPMWAKEVMGGIGSPVMMLNYQLPYMVGELWHQLGLSIFDSYKFSLSISLVVSGVLMYLALGSRLSPISSFVGALIYTLAPYRFVDIYVRGALGESLSFMFPPLLIWGFSTKSWPLLILGWAGLFLTHPTASAAFSAFFLGYVLLSSSKNKLLDSLKLFWGPYAIALLIGAFNLLPTLALTAQTYYSPILSDTLLMFPTLAQLFHSPWGYGVSLPGRGDGMSFELGLVQWGVLIIGLMSLGKVKNWTITYLTIASLTVLFFILPISSSVYQLFHLTEIIDFPWRLILCLVFATGWMGAELINQLNNKLMQKLLTVTVSMILIALALPMAHTDKYWDKPLTWFARETGDSYGEYAPRTRSTRDSAPFWKRAEFVKGEGEIVTQIERSNHKRYLVTSKSEGEIRINTAFFPGWEIPDACFVTKRTLSHIDDSGLIGCKVSAGEHIVEIKFVAPPVQRLGNLLTLAGIGAYLWILFRLYYPRSTKKMR